MPKIKHDEFDMDIFDEFIETKDKKKKKKKDKKKKKKKKHNKKKKHKNNNKKKKKNKKKVKGYVGTVADTTNELYSYRRNRNIINRIFDSFRINVDLDSKVDVSVKDETIAAAINVAAGLLGRFLEKRLIK